MLRRDATFVFIACTWLLLTSACGDDRIVYYDPNATDGGAGGGASGGSDAGASSGEDASGSSGGQGGTQALTRDMLDGMRLSYEYENEEFDSSQNGSVATSYRYAMTLDLCGNTFDWNDAERSCVSVSGSFGGSGYDCTPPDDYNPQLCSAVGDELLCRLQGTWQLGSANGTTTLDLQAEGVGAVQVPIRVSGNSAYLNDNEGTIGPSPACR